MAKKKPCIVIDPGHGGEDTGAISYDKVEEKMVVLGVCKLIKQYLRGKGYDTVLTRNTDRFVMLNQRTAFANGLSADLFVSVHANAALNKEAFGVETFYYPHGYGDVQHNAGSSYIKSYLVQKTSFAQLLAQAIQRSLCGELSTVHSMAHSIDRKVKKAPFQVLIGTAQPSVLVEIGFLTHMYEGKLLATKTYQKKVAQGIVKGIIEYINTVVTV